MCGKFQFFIFFFNFIYWDRFLSCIDTHSQPENRCHAENKGAFSQTVSNIQGSRKAAWLTNKFPQLCSGQKCFASTCLFSSWWLLDEPSAQKFQSAVNKVLLFVLLRFLLEVGRFFFPDCTSRIAELVLLCWYKWEHLSLLFWWAVIYSVQLPKTASCHFSVSCHLAGVSCGIYSTCICFCSTSFSPCASSWSLHRHSSDTLYC